jgi:sulfite reductase (NADPH) flavoprotein alpha-component
VLLNDRGSNKQTHHIEIGADDIDYLPGDSLGVIPENPASVVDPIIELLGVRRDERFTLRNEELSVLELLKKKLNIFYLPERVVSKYAALVKQDIPATRIGLLELLRIYPLNSAAQFRDLIGILEPIAPRLYSISSSPDAHSGEVHITVARDKFHVNEEWKCGLCSDFLSQLSVDSTIEFYYGWPRYRYCSIQVISCSSRCRRRGRPKLAVLWRPAFCYRLSLSNRIAELG